MSIKSIFCGAWDFKGQIRGVKAFAQQDNTGCWEEKGVYGDLPGQSILTVAGDKLVSVCELEKGGRVVSYGIQDDGALKPLNALEFASAKLSYVAAAPDGKHVYVSSMGDGTVKMIRLDADGRLTLTDEWQLTGHSVTPRQNQAKVHSVMISPDGKLLAAANLGADEVELFRVDEETETIRLTDSKPIDFGKQPRHMAFHTSGEWLYVLTEAGNRLYVFRVKNERLREYAAYNVLDPDGEQESAAADIVMSRDGRYLYTTNRGQNNIVLWHTLTSGLLDRVAFFDCGGKGPRGLHLSSDETALFSANYDDGSVTVLPVDPVTGGLGAPVQKLSVPLAGCVRSK